MRLDAAPRPYRFMRDPELPYELNVPIVTAAFTNALRMYVHKARPARS